MTNLEKLARQAGLNVQTVAFDSADIYKGSSMGWFAILGLVVVVVGLLVVFLPWFISGGR